MVILIVISAALLIFLISADASWGNVLSAKRNNLVFEGRNLEYGAYALRKEHPRTMLISLCISAGVVGLLLFAVQASQNVPPPQPPKVLEDLGILVILPPVEEEKPEIEKPKLESTRPEIPKTAGTTTETTVEVTEIPEPQPDEEITTAGQGGEETGDNRFPADSGVGEGTGSGEGDGKDGTETGTGTGSSFYAGDYAEFMPEFPGGEAAMLKYMVSRVRYSDFDKDRGVQGTIYISFVVHTDGSITNIQVIRGIHNGDGLAKKAMKAISEMPKWTPGSNGKHPVPVRYTMPLRFELKN